MASKLAAGEDRRVVGRARGDRRGRRAVGDRRRGRRPGRRHRDPPARRAPVEPQALDRVRAPGERPDRRRRRRSRTHCAPTTARCSRPASAGVEGSFEPDDAVEIVDDTGAPFAKGLVRYSAAGLRDVAGSPHLRARRGPVPRGRPSRRLRRLAMIRDAASTAEHDRDTTEGGLAGPALAQGCVFRHTTARYSSLTGGGRAFYEGFDGQRGVGGW